MKKEFNNDIDMLETLGGMAIEIAVDKYLQGRVADSPVDQLHEALDELYKSFLEHQKKKNVSKKKPSTKSSTKKKNRS